MGHKRVDGLTRDPTCLLNGLDRVANRLYPNSLDPYPFRAGRVLIAAPSYACLIIYESYTGNWFVVPNQQL